MLTSKELERCGRPYRPNRWGMSLRICIAYILWILIITCILMPQRWDKSMNLLSDGQWALVVLLALLLFIDVLVINTFHRS